MSEAITPAGARPAETDPRAARRSALLWWGLGGLITIPISILPHELGHYLFFLALGAPDLVLHYAVVTWDFESFFGALQRGNLDAANAVMPYWGVVLAIATGPLITYATVAGCVFMCLKGRAVWIFLPLSIGSQLRIWPASQHVVRATLGLEPPGQGMYDELLIGWLTGIPVQLLVGFAMLLIAVSVPWLLVRFLPAGQRLTAGAAMTGGITASVYLYLGILGPWLLP